MTDVGTSSSGHDLRRFKARNVDTEATGGSSSPRPSNGVAYGVAIYPYMAEQDDEFDVVV